MHLSTLRRFPLNESFGGYDVDNVFKDIRQVLVALDAKSIIVGV